MWFAESAKESCVVALDTSRGLLGVTECEVEGRESRKPRFGRGGSGGGVPSLDIPDASDNSEVDFFLDKLLIMLMVGLAKSCCSTLSLFLGAGAGGLGALESALPEAADSSTEGGSVMSATSAVIEDMFYAA